MKDYTNFPRQLLPNTKKTKKWGEENMDWAENISYSNNGRIRKSLRNKTINFNLYNGVLYMGDLTYYVNPHNKKLAKPPTKIQHYAVMNEPIDLLAGEEINRKSNMVASVVNPDSISLKEESKMKAARQMLLQMMQSDKEPEEEASELERFLNYNWQDLREVRANHILKHFMRDVDFDTKLNQGFKHVLINTEEIYLFDISNGNPTMEVLNPKKVYTLRSGLSNRIEDADIIIIDDYWSPGAIQDRFYADLSKKDSKYISELLNNPNSNTGDGVYFDEKAQYIYLPDPDEEYYDLENNLSAGYEGGLPRGNWVDGDGNIRVLRMYWRSSQKVLKVTKIDLETGDTYDEFESEDYVIDKDLGEKSEEYWRNEIWEGTKIGGKIYLNIKPREIQYRRMANISICNPPIVGQIYSTNQLKPQSLVDKMKPLQYTYDVVMYDFLKDLSTNVGKIGEIDLAKIPEKWSIDKFLHFVKTEHLAFVDSFKESNKGIPAGGYNTIGGRAVDLDLTENLRFQIEILSYLKNAMYDLVGITPQRLGDVHNRETLGGIERAVTQSSHITAEIFAIHDNVKKRCAERLLETAKYALKGNQLKLPYVTNEGINGILDIDGDDFAESDYGIFIENDLDLAGLRQKLEQSAQAWSQNGTVKPSTIMSIFTDTSLMSIQRRIEKDELEQQQRVQEEQQQQIQVQQQQIQATQQAEAQRFQLEQAKLELEDLMNQRDNATKMQIELLKQSNNEGVDNTEDIEKLQLDKNKFDQEINLKKDQLSETKRHNIAQESISKTNKTNKNTK